MNAKETAGLLTYFANAWPHAQVTEEQVGIWSEQLIGVLPDDGRAAAKDLVASSEWFPTIAAFREACAATQRRRTMSQHALPDTPMAPRETQRKMTDLLRRILDEGVSPCEALEREPCGECRERRETNQ